MLKRTLVAAAVAALLAAGVQAGEIKSHEWPTQFVYLEIASIPAVMDIGYWVTIKDQDKLRIKLVQDELDIHKYKGCVDMVVEANFAATFSCSIEKTGAVPGDYSCSITPSTVVPPGGTLNVCAMLAKADLSKTPGGSKDIHVATVKVKVRPL